MAEGVRQDFLNKVKKLNVYRGQGYPSPHKPVLVLTILDLTKRGQIFT